MELQQSWPRKKIELEHSTAAGISALLRPRAGGSVAAPGGWSVPGQTPSSPSSTLSAAVREMLAAQRCKPAAKRARGAERGCEANAAAAVLPTARTRQALAKRFARCMLRRRGADGGGTKVVLACFCERLPRGVRCALHQRGGDAPGRPCTRDGGGGARGWAFGEYARWRRSVWVPSRFYLESAGVGPEERRAPPRPALLVERTARCGGVSVRRFLFVGGDPEQSGSGM